MSREPGFIRHPRPWYDAFMKTAGKVALVGLGVLGVLGLPAFLMTGNLKAFLPGSTKITPEEMKSAREAYCRENASRRASSPRMMPAPDGSGRLVPIVGSVGNPRGHYG